MSNISSAISTHENDEPPRRFPWRLLLVFLLLAGAIIHLLIAAPPAWRAYRDAQRRQVDLPLAGVAAEGVEQLLALSPEATTDLGDVLTPLFIDDPDPADDLAYVRIWDLDGRLLCEVTRDAPDAARDRGVLPALNAPQVRQAAQGRVWGAQRREDLAVLLQLATDQGELTGRLGEALRTGKAAGSHGGLYVQQDDNLRFVEVLLPRHPALRDTARDMEDALDALTRTDEASVVRALRASEAAQAALTLALTEMRATGDLVLGLPSRLTRSAVSSGWGRRLLPVWGRRVAVPLFVPALDASGYVPAGTAEVVFYEYLADTALAVGRRTWLAGVLLLAALLIALPWRRRR